jgi:spermidine/putrescine transport system permease protein
MVNTKKSIPGLMFLLLVIIFLYLPIAILIIFSFNDSLIMAFPLKGFTFEWYRQMFNSTELWNAAWNSVVVGIVSSLIATVLGTAAAIAIMRNNLPGKNFFLGLSSVPLVMPAIVMGVAMLILFRQILDMRLSLWMVIIGHALINIPSTILIVMARLAGFSKNIEEAAMDLGANYWETLIRVTIPICLPALFAAFLTSFTTSFDEYAMTTLITGTKTTLPVYLYSQLRFPRKLPVTLAMGSIVMLASAVIVLLAEWLRDINFSFSKKEKKS